MSIMKETPEKDTRGSAGHSIITDEVRERLGNGVAKREEGYVEAIRQHPDRGHPCIDCLARVGLGCPLFDPSGKKKGSITKEEAGQVIDAAGVGVNQECRPLVSAVSLAATRLLPHVGSEADVDSLTKESINDVLATVLLEEQSK